MYQIDEPLTEVFSATIKAKRIFKSFVGEVRSPRSVLEYYVTFTLDGGEDIEYQVGRESYDQVIEGQKGSLVLVGGSFFTFDCSDA